MRELRVAYAGRHLDVSRRWNRKNPEKKRATSQRYQRQNPEKGAESMRRYTKRHPEKLKAHSAVSHAVRDGRLKRPDLCERCGRPGRPIADGRAPIQAHHHDYSKPLEVEWLCIDCHGAEHHDQPD
jgi:hypothetical protein